LRIAALALAFVGLTAAAARDSTDRRATGALAFGSWAYLPGSTIRISVNGFGPPYGTAVIGSGRVDGGVLHVPDDAAPGEEFVVAGNNVGLATALARVAAPPDGKRPLLAVASYDSGIAMHDAATFAPLGLLATGGGAPSDVAVDSRNRIVATDTQGSALSVASIAPWSVSRIDGVPVGDEIAVDSATGAIFATNRDVDGSGALTRVDANGSVTLVKTGLTAEGLAVDAKRGLVYVANVNDGTVAVVDAATMRVTHRFNAVARVFSLALSPDGSRLYAVSNQSTGSPFSAPGCVVAIALDTASPHVVARSGVLTFPIGIALDPASARLYVTDEEDDAVDVLDARTLRPAGAPLPTCRTPWKPTIDGRRLYVACARADAIDVIDMRTLHRVKGAPFATAGYPLAVAVWHP
jgi:DNA-binding beta-propeller fold protein YncE